MEQNKTAQDNADKKSSKKEKISETNENIEIISLSKYKLHLYTNRGLLRTEIPRAIFAEYSLKYGDIIRAIPSNSWWTAEEIVEYYYTLEKRFKFDRRRTPDQIKNSLVELENAGFVKVKRS